MYYLFAAAQQSSAAKLPAFFKKILNWSVDFKG